jgi:hypothetical protein
MHAVLTSLLQDFVDLGPREVGSSEEAAETDDLEERITVLRSELNSKVKVVECLRQVVELVVWVLSHGDPCSFTPDLT